MPSLPVLNLHARYSIGREWNLFSVSCFVSQKAPGDFHSQGPSVYDMAEQSRWHSLCIHAAYVPLRLGDHIS